MAKKEYKGNGIQVSIDPAPKKFKRDFDNYKKRVSNGTPTMKKIGVYLDRWVQKNFKTEGGKVGGWKPFKHGGRINQKGIGTPIEIWTGNFMIDAYLDTSAKLLQDTGRLRISFTPFATKDNAGIGSDLVYSEAHNEGLGALPKRRMLPLYREVRKDVRKIMRGRFKK